MYTMWAPAMLQLPEVMAAAPYDSKPTQLKPALVLVQGDTTSAFAAGLAAFHERIGVAHVEAGLRSFNRRMPEELNRIVADHLSSILFCPTETAVENLRREGIEAQIGTYALHRLGAYRDQGPFPGADRCYERALALPFHTGLGADDVERVAAVLDKVVSNH